MYVCVRVCALVPVPVPSLRAWPTAEAKAEADAKAAADEATNLAAAAAKTAEEEGPYKWLGV